MKSIAILRNALAVLLLGAVGSAWSGWGPAAALEVNEDKADDFAVYFKPDKDAFKVGEELSFTIKPNKTCYLYLILIDEKNKEGRVLLPNLKQQYHKYEAGKSYRVPEKNAPINLDSPGLKKLIAVASTTKLDIDWQSQQANKGFYSGSAEKMQGVMEKALVIRRKEERVNMELDLLIVGAAGGEEQETVEEADGEVGAFVSTDRLQYRIGDQMKISFGADKSGPLELYEIGPDGERRQLRKMLVQAGRAYQVKGRVGGPAGEYQVMAVYVGKSEKGGGGAQAKGVTLIEDEEEEEEVAQPYALYRYRIDEK